VDRWTYNDDCVASGVLEDIGAGHNARAGLLHCSLGALQRCVRLVVEAVGNSLLLRVRSVQHDGGVASLKARSTKSLDDISKRFII
jgi:hypothetical protein